MGNPGRNIFLALCGTGGAYILKSCIPLHSSHSVSDTTGTGFINIFTRYLNAEANVFESSGNEMINYSGTHTIDPVNLYEPENTSMLEKIVSESSKSKSKIRPVGRFMSPNGIASCKGGMVSLAFCDRILNVDVEKQQVTVEAGAVVESVLKELAKYNLTLSNFSSIKEQQMGGWTQVGAHGTGARLPTVDEMIVSLKVITPSRGAITLTNDYKTTSNNDPELFRLIRCGLGALGIVSEMTLQCIPSHWLKEITETKSATEIRSIHAQLLNDYRHVRYMWIPYTNDVVVVKSNPTDSRNSTFTSVSEEALQPLRSLLQKTKNNIGNQDSINKLSFSELREKLLDIAPLDAEHVKAVNIAEAEFWRLSGGIREAPSDEILGFDCGGEQWVLEMAFPTGSLKTPSYADLDFMAELKNRLEEAKIPAPSPIEQRWSSSSTSYMSPAFSENPDEMFSWVGVIMYLPSGQGELERAKITTRFEEYADIMQDIGKKYGAVPHWAKIELPTASKRIMKDEEMAIKLKEIRERVRNRYDVARYNSARKRLDPNHILSNELIEQLFD